MRVKMQEEFSHSKHPVESRIVNITSIGLQFHVESSQWLSVRPQITRQAESVRWYVLIDLSADVKNTSVHLALDIFGSPVLIVREYLMFMRSLALKHWLLDLFVRDT